MLKKNRKEKGVIAKKLVELSGDTLRLSGIYMLEAGKEMTLDKFYIILDLLNITPDEFFLNGDEIREEQGRQTERFKISMDEGVFCGFVV